MLFNSLEFLFFFLPITLVGFYTSARFSRQVASTWLFLASLFFYGWFNWRYVGLLLGSILFHFWVGIFIAKAIDQVQKKRWMWFAIVVDLAALIFYKYADMLISTANYLSTAQINALNVVLPIGISFFTFTQIAYIVDVYEGRVSEKNPIHFGLFVTYFPHLIAGPVLHHKEMMPQFKKPLTYKLRASLFTLGIAIFVVGLAKKVLLADNLAPFANAMYSGRTEDLGFFEAWNGALSYAFQLYFDFSGYSDMAVGLSLLFGVKLPINFFSPYKAQTISEFWRRWHMTLSRFLRDYLYIRLGGNRKGKMRRYVNLLTTMFLGGLWHGAGWNFALWGLMHGTLLCIQEAWSSLIPQSIKNRSSYKKFSVGLTFLVVVLAWVPFRAPNLETSFAVWKAMFGLNGFSLPEIFFSMAPSLGNLLTDLGFRTAIGGGSRMIFGYAWIFIASAIVFSLPNTYQLLRKFRSAIIDRTFTVEVLTFRGAMLRFNGLSAVWIGALVAFSILAINRPSEFLYFQF